MSRVIVVVENGAVTKTFVSEPMAVDILDQDEYNILKEKDSQGQLEPQEQATLCYYNELLKMANDEDMECLEG